MKKLSPEAQAVLDGFRAVPDLRDCPSIAGALRAAADVTVPEQQKPDTDTKWRAFVRYEERNSLRAKLLAIADELEGH